MDRIFLVVLDGVGIGSLPDAELYGDAGSNTLANTAAAVGGLVLPNFTRWGMGNLAKIAGVAPIADAAAANALMAEVSPGKDTTTGHWELCGLVLSIPFPTYPGGFPSEIIQRFSEAIGRPVLGNYASSGTEIIERLGSEHLATGSPIVYTSADSVFQIAAHQEIIPLPTLYEWCQTARAILTGRHGVARVIARPFLGSPGSFKRTASRRDFSLPPTGETVLDRLAANGLGVFGLGKIEDIFAHRGLTKSNHTGNNAQTLQALREAVLHEERRGLVFANCIDFDMVFGHRNDPRGFAASLQEADQALGGIAALLKPGDLLCITADHGCDPTTPSTDHSREYVPLIIAGPGVNPVSLGIRDSFADLGATVIDLFELPPWPVGRSFARDLFPV